MFVSPHVIWCHLLILLLSIRLLLALHLFFFCFMRLYFFFAHFFLCTSFIIIALFLFLGFRNEKKERYWSVKHTSNKFSSVFSVSSVAAVNTAVLLSRAFWRAFTCIKRRFHSTFLKAFLLVKKFFRIFWHLGFTAFSALLDDVI